jgi:acyl dehydratase
MSTSDTYTGSKPRELNEETMELLRRRIGINVRYSTREHNEYSSVDSFRHFALAYGDDKPLYTDRAYAEASSWGGSIAPTLYPFCSGIRRPVELTDAERAEMKGGDPLAGIGQYMAGERWIFPKPIRVGDVLWQSQSLFDAQLKESKFGDGVGALVTHRVAWEDEDGQPYAYRYLDFMHAERDKSKKASTNRTIERPEYTDEDLQRIDAAYAAEASRVRGATPRLIGEVTVGEELGPLTKGPMCVTDLVNWHAGVGWGMFGSGTSRVAYQNRKRIPKFYLKNQLGFWDTAQRCHWDDDWAQRMGHPAAYDYGVMRSNWMVHLVSDWAGDDAWLWKLTTSARKFNYLGDMHTITGVVREIDTATNAVTIDLKGENQNGVVTCDARAVVILPPAGGGHAAIPDFEPSDVPEPAAP